MPFLDKMVDQSVIDDVLDLTKDACQARGIYIRPQTIEDMFLYPGRLNVAQGDQLVTHLQVFQCILDRLYNLHLLKQCYYCECGETECPKRRDKMNLSISATRSMRLHHKRVIEWIFVSLILRDSNLLDPIRWLHKYEMWSFRTALSRKMIPFFIICQCSSAMALLLLQQYDRLIDTNEKNDRGETALHIAASYNTSTELIQHLVAKMWRDLDFNTFSNTLNSVMTHTLSWLKHFYQIGTL